MSRKGLKRFAVWSLGLMALVGAGAALAEGLLIYLAGPGYFTAQTFPIVYEKVPAGKSSVQLAAASAVPQAAPGEVEKKSSRQLFAEIVRVWVEIQTFRMNEAEGLELLERGEEVVLDFRTREVIVRITVGGLPSDLREKLLREMAEEEKSIAPLEEILPEMRAHLANVRRDLEAREQWLAPLLIRYPHFHHFLEGWPDSRAALGQEPPPRRLSSFWPREYSMTKQGQHAVYIIRHRGCCEGIETLREGCKSGKNVLFWAHADETEETRGHQGTSET